MAAVTMMMMAEEEEEEEEEGPANPEPRPAAKRASVGRIRLLPH